MSDTVHRSRDGEGAPRRRSSWVPARQAWDLVRAAQADHGLGEELDDLLGTRLGD